MAEYFDAGCSRRVEWLGRPQAAALLTALSDHDRGFDALVVGEYERAFCGSQLTRLAPILQRHGVALWLPEFDGPLDHSDLTHQAVIRLLGAQSKREPIAHDFEPWPQWKPSPERKAATSAGGHRTDTG